MLLATLMMLLSNAFVAFLQIDNPLVYPEPLSHSEETALFHKIKAQSPDADAARDTLICHNLRLVTHIVRKYYPSAKNQEDLISIGTVGLMKAVDSFDPDNGARFTTYAARCLQNEILMHFRSQKKFAADVSIQETIDIDKEGNPLTYMDIIAEEDTIADDLSQKMRIQQLRECVDSILDEREREIIIMRYGLGRTPAVTQRVCAEKLGISRSYISRIEKSALGKLRAQL